MLEFYLKQLNADKTLKDALPMIIEAFVDYYGEEERDNIEKKFYNTSYIGYINESNMLHALICIKNELTKYLLLELENEFDVSEIEKELLFANNNTSLEFDTLLNISKIAKYIELEKLGKEVRFRKKRERGIETLNYYHFDVTLENVDEFLQSEKFSLMKTANADFYNMIMSYFDDSEMVEYERSKEDIIEVVKTLYPSINEDNLSDLVNDERLNKMIAAYNDKLDYFDKFCAKLASYEDKVTEMSDQRIAARDRAHILLYDKYHDYINEAFLTRMKEYGNTRTADKYFRDDGIFSFTSECNSILEDDEASLWRKDSIMSDRVNFFKMLGVDKGDNYEDYKDCFNLLPSQEIIDQMKNEYDKLMENLEIQSLKDNDYWARLEELQRLNLVCDANYYSANLLKNIIACVCPDARKIGDRLEVHPLLFLSMNSLAEYLDDIIIHECNHRFELSLDGEDEHGLSFLCGWDYLYQEKDAEMNDTLEKDESKRDYELFNEIINEMIAQEITALMHKNGKYIFNNERFGKITGGTSYEISRFLVQDFFTTYKKDILASRKDGNIEVIFNRVGKENFDKLNKIVVDFNARFPSIFALADARRKMREGKVDEDTRALSEFENARDSVLEDMKTYSLSMVY